MQVCCVPSDGRNGLSAVFCVAHGVVLRETDRVVLSCPQTSKDLFKRYKSQLEV